MAKIANKNCRSYVEERMAFEASNIFSEHQVVGTYPLDSQHYTVYSYGYHFPMYIFVGIASGVSINKWFGNSSTSSRSTSRQRSQAMPWGVDITWLPLDKMNFLRHYGFVRLHSVRVASEIFADNSQGVSA